MPFVDGDEFVLVQFVMWRLRSTGLAFFSFGIVDAAILPGNRRGLYAKCAAVRNLREPVNVTKQSRPDLRERSMNGRTRVGGRGE